MTPEEIRQGLTQFIGTQRYHRITIVGPVATDGVAWLCEKARCFWLADVIASYQPCLRGEDFQVWRLTVNPDRSALVVCEDGNGKVLKAQDIPFTDFPLDGIKVYVQNGVMMLPSEY